jgi:hypothetical protein
MCKDEKPSEISAVERPADDYQVVELPPVSQARARETFQTQGFLKLPNLLSSRTCEKLRDWIIDELEDTLQLPAETMALRLSTIRMRQHRYDLNEQLCHSSNSYA